MNADFEPMVPRPRLPETPEPSVPESLQYPFWTYEDVALFFGMGIPCLVLSLVVMEGIAWLLPFRMSRPLQQLSSQFIGYVLWFASLVLLLRTRYEAPFWSSLAWLMPKRGFWAAVLIGPVLAIGIASMSFFLRTPNLQLPMEEMLADRSSMMMTGVFAVTIGPLCEEL